METLKTNPNRNERRRLKKHRAKLPAHFARRMYDHTSDGAVTRITHPAAVIVLEAAFLCYLNQMANGIYAPLIRLLTEEDAKAFPRYNAVDNPPGSKPWLAVCTDAEGQGRYVLQHIVPVGDSEAEINVHAATIISHFLMRSCQDLAVPIGKPRGSC